jgi:hypothetical protein
MWTYEQKSGILRHNGAYVATGYAGGNCGQNPEGINNPDMQDVPKVGPLPQGKYTFGMPVEGTHLGPYAIPLIPDAGNQMFGRSGFYCHGDTSVPRSASEGCMIFARGTRNQIGNSPDEDLEVVSGVQ